MPVLRGRPQSLHAIRAVIIATGLKIMDGPPSRARRSLNGKPGRFLAEDLRHAPAALRRPPPASSHENVNMAEAISFDDFTLFDTN
jgi:hypothetical protein